jgi:hypothetical protein
LVQKNVLPEELNGHVDLLILADQINKKPKPTRRVEEPPLSPVPE